MINRSPFYILTLVLTFLICIATLSSASLAQGKDEGNVQSLNEILNQKTDDYGSNGKPLTSAIMANNYFKTCTDKKNLAFDKEETEILCGCNAAKMSELLSVQEFKDLEKDNKQGKEARGRSLAYAYAPCMKHVIEKKVKNDCYVANQLNDIIAGKKTLCKCVVDKYKYFLDQNASYIIMKAVQYDPMTLNPLEDYFKKTDYRSQHNHFIKQCRFQFFYDKDNKKH